MYINSENLITPVKESSLIKPDNEKNIQDMTAVLNVDNKDKNVHNVSTGIKFEKTVNTLEHIDGAVNFANKAAKLFDTHLNFSIDDNTNQVIIKIINNETKEVIRQIPPETFLKTINEFEKYGSLIFNERF
jgi:flagellar protein FlaG